MSRLQKRLLLVMVLMYLSNGDWYNTKIW
jgi:hypothetical protein